MWWLVFPALVAAFLILIIVRALCFIPKPHHKVPLRDVQVNSDTVCSHLAQMIRCRTISCSDESQRDEAEFEKFRNLLIELYPNIQHACTLEYVGNGGILYKLPGQSSDAPSVFMSHYDVVPADDAAWDKPPFDAVIEDGVLWGRGTLDTKTTLLATLESAEMLIAGGFIPKNDMYFAFGADEELSGTCAQAMVEQFKARGITPAFVFDEGGAVVEGVFPGLKQPCALIGTGEKGYLDVDFTICNNGGHASTPPPHTSVGLLANAVANVENHPFPRKLTKPVAELLDTLGRHSSFLYRLIFANLWCFMPLLDAICKSSGGELNAMLRTTCAFTRMQGSSAPNVLPPCAMVGANLRIIGGETPEFVLDHLRRVVHSDKISLTGSPAGLNHPSSFSDTSGKAWEKLSAAIAQTWPDAIISPYLMVAGSDSTYYSHISKYVYRFSGMALTSDERARMHGHNERIPLSKVIATVQFYVRLMEMF
ncbi:MAG: M20/M25/M40 family metallo-hydrolase [Clostridia bacterium]